MANGHPPRVVGIVGGTGGNTFVRGLMRYRVHVTALCSVTDSGGSTGRLYREFGDWFAQGDIRNCMEAMMPAEKPALKAMLGLMFEGTGNGLSGHKFGNAAILAAQQYGEKYLDNPVAGLRALGRELGLRGEVLPASADRTTLIGRYSDSTERVGEDKIDMFGQEGGFEDTMPTLKKVRFQNRIYICPEAHKEIQKADLIIIGPGDLYTSVIPTLMVEGMADAIRQSPARVMFVTNLMTKHAETRHYTALNFIESIFEYGFGRDHLDAVLVNSTAIPEDILNDYYKEEKAEAVLPILHGSVDKRVRNVVHADLLSQSSLKLGKPIVRHGSGRLARLIMDFVHK
jgi:uncharacterized cofD-like protein